LLALFLSLTFNEPGRFLSTADKFISLLKPLSDVNTFYFIF